jgi:hypothetical protein
VLDIHVLPPHDILTCGFSCRSFSRAGHRTCDLRLIRHVLTALAPQTRRLVLLENVMTFPSIANGAALRSVLGWLHDAGFPHVHHRVLSLDCPAHRPAPSEAALVVRCYPHPDPHVCLAHTTSTEPTPGVSRRSAPHTQTPPLPPHPCPRRPAAADSPHPTPVPTRLPPPPHATPSTRAYTTCLAWRPPYRPPAPCTYGTTAHKPGCYKYASSPGFRACRTVSY